MDLSKMFRACKIGDLVTLQMLVKTKDVDVNFRDKFDSTPLYYACLCGHLNVVRFLLEHGAKCDVKTFDGERCVYGALTDEIRRLLLDEYKVISKKIICRNDYDEFLRKSLETGQYCDIKFLVHGKTFWAHLYILMARCPYFYEMFTGKWRGRKVINIKNVLVNPVAFEILLHFLYTGTLEFQFNLHEDVQRLFKHCQLHDVLEKILLEVLNTIQSKPKNKNKNVLITIEYSVEKDYRKLFFSCLPNNLENYNQSFESEKFDHEEILTIQSLTSDVVFLVEQNYLFRCHKLFFAGRSDYFVAMIRDHFEESIQINENDEDLVFGLGPDIKVELFILIIRFLYTNHCEMTLDQACELLHISDVYLLTSLKRHCAAIIANEIDKFNCVDIIHLARAFNLPKLEASATQFIAENLNQYLNQEDFQRLVLEDAQNVHQRQETDTIDIIDDIRYYLSISLRKRPDLIQDELRNIDLLLESLGLEA